MSPHTPDQNAIHRHLSQDAALAQVLATTTIAWPTTGGDPYASLLRAIVYQQLSGKAAATIHGRFLALFEDGYPHPAELVALDIPTLRAAGLSNQKAGYLHNVADFFDREGLADRDWASGMDDEAIIRYLTQIKGVGQWTVEMLLMFTLGRPDVFPLDDLGIQQAVAQLYGLQETGRALRARMTALAEPWRPYRTYAALYLWRWKDGGE